MVRELGCKIVGPFTTVVAAVAAIGESELDGALLDMNLHGERIPPAVKKLLVQGVRIPSRYGLSCGRGDEPVLKDAPRLTNASACKA